MPRYKQINLRVSEAQKADWEEYIEETEDHASLSHLIRSAVENDISENTKDSDGPEPGLSSDIKNIHNELSQVRRDVAWLRRQEQEEVDISEFAQDVYDELQVLPTPTGEVHVPEGMDMDVDEYRRVTGAMNVIQPEGPEDAESTPQTARAIADRLGSNTERVLDAIEHLQDQFLPVVEVEVDGQTHYFREE